MTEPASWIDVFNVALKEPVYSVLLGAAVSLATTLAVQTRAFREARRERAKSDLEKRQMLGYSLFIKLSAILSDYAGLNGHLRSSIPEYKIDTSPEILLGRLLPIVNFPTDIEFSADEMANLIYFKEAKLFSDLTYVDRRFNSCVGAWRRYGEKRMALRDAPEKTIDHATLELRAAIPRGSALELDLIEAKTLLPEIQRSTEEGEKEAAIRLNDLVRVMNEKMGMKIKLV